MALARSHRPACRDIHRRRKRAAAQGGRCPPLTVGSGVDGSVAAPADDGSDVRGAAARAALRHRRLRARPARRDRALPPGRRDRRRAADRVGPAVAPLVRPEDPRRRPAAVPPRPGGRARDVVQRRGVDRGGSPVVGQRGTYAGASRSTASGSTSGPTSALPASTASASMRRRPAAGPSRRGSSFPTRRRSRCAAPGRSAGRTSTATGT